MKLIDIVKRAIGMTGTKLQFSSVSTSDNPTAVKIFYMAQEAAEDIINYRHNWTDLKRKSTITVTEGKTLYNLPNDFIRVINNTMFIDNWPVKFQTNDQVIASNVYTADIEKARIYNGQLELIDVSPGTLTFDYISNNGVKNANGEEKSNFDRDDDEWLLDDTLIIRWIRFLYLSQNEDSAASQANSHMTARLKQVLSNDINAHAFVPCATDDSEMHPPYMKGTT